MKSISYSLSICTACVLLCLCACRGVALIPPPEGTPKSDASPLGLEDLGTPFGDDIVGDPEETTAISTDKDNDGFHKPMDCDDNNTWINPDAPEQCNGVDDDCDNFVDEEAGSPWFEDSDLDSYGRDDSAIRSCAPIAGRVLVGGDCDDNDATINPESEAHISGVDSDCDGKRDWEVTIYAATDDAGELCVNTIDPIIGETGGWVHGSSHLIWLETGTHAIGIKGWDLGKVITAAIAHVETPEGIVVVSDATWRYDPNPAADEGSRLGWCSPGFDDGDWDKVLDVGPIGDPANPWNDAPSAFPGGSPAHWIWDHFPVNLNTQYLRKEFTLP